MIICGIDPGLNGGVSFLDSNMKLHAEKAPTFQFTVGKKKKTVLDMWTLIAMIDDYKIDHVYIESQQAMPKQGVSSTFKTGFGYGLYIGILVCKRLSYTEVSSRTWKPMVNCPADKDASRMRASQLFPNYSNLWTLKNQDGIAESAMIAYYGLIQQQSSQECASSQH
tara:strand:+ start:1327 stop:1827 length:501 start_codon:yes stop_codon:yes gene_type:complete